MYYALQPPVLPLLMTLLRPSLRSVDGLRDGIVQRAAAVVGSVVRSAQPPHVPDVVEHAPVAGASEAEVGRGYAAGAGGIGGEGARVRGRVVDGGAVGRVAVGHEDAGGEVQEELEDVGGGVVAAEVRRGPVELQRGELGVVRVQRVVGGAADGARQGGAEEEARHAVRAAGVGGLVVGQQDQAAAWEGARGEERRDEGRGPGSGVGEGRGAAGVCEVGDDKGVLGDGRGGDVGVQVGEGLEVQQAGAVEVDAVKCCKGAASWLARGAVLGKPSKVGETRCRAEQTEGRGRRAERAEK